MILWRIEHSRHLDAVLTGTGARLFGGRWNRKGSALIYLSSTLGLSAFEKFVHMQSAGRHDSLWAVALEVPDNLLKKAQEPVPLPPAWRSPEPDMATMQWGSDWAESGGTLAARLPSALLPLDVFLQRMEFNVALNPEHNDMRKVRVAGNHHFSFDPRMWKDR